MASAIGPEMTMQGVWSEEDGEDGGLEYSESASTGVTRLSTTSVRSENPGEGSVEDIDAMRLMFGGAVRICCTATLFLVR